MKRRDDAGEAGSNIPLGVHPFAFSGVRVRAASYHDEWGAPIYPNSRPNHQRWNIETTFGSPRNNETPVTNPLGADGVVVGSHPVFVTEYYFIRVHLAKSRCCFAKFHSFQFVLLTILWNSASYKTTKPRLLEVSPDGGVAYCGSAAAHLGGDRASRSETGVSLSHNRAERCGQRPHGAAPRGKVRKSARFARSLAPGQTTAHRWGRNAHSPRDVGDGGLRGAKTPRETNGGGRYTGTGLCRVQFGACRAFA